MKSVAKKQKCVLCDGTGDAAPKSMTELRIVKEAMDYHLKVKAAVKQALEDLKAAKNEGPEEGHLKADSALVAILDAMGLTEVTKAFKAVSKWYA